MNKLVLSLLLTSLPVFCADEALPKAETILDKYVDAVGGKATFEKHRTEVMHGSVDFTGRGVKGKMTVYQSAPDQNLSILELEGIGRIESGSNGDVAWDNSAIQGPRVKSGSEKVDALRDGTFNAPVYWRKLYAKAETTASETVEGHECYKVVLTPKEGSPTTHWYDKKSGLLIKTTATRTTPMGEITVDVIADDYRKEGDVLAPHKMTNRVSGTEFQILVESVEFNVDLPKDRFDLPPEIKALVKKNASAPAESKTTSPAPANSVTGKLNVFMAGNPMATETYSVQRSGGKIEVSGSGNATMGPMKITIDQFKVVTDDQYQLLEAAAKAKLGQVQMNVKTSFADGKAKNEVDNGQGVQAKEDDVHANAVVVNANLPLYPWSFLAMRAELKNQDPQTFNIYVLNQGEVPATVVFKGREPVQFAGKTVELNHINASGKTPQGSPISLDFWLDDSRKVIKIVVPAQSVEAYQEGFDRIPPPPKPSQN